MSINANGVWPSTTPTATQVSAGDTKTTEKVQPSAPAPTESPAAKVEISPEARSASQDSK